jgi:hypothetical protein
VLGYIAATTMPPFGVIIALFVFVRGGRSYSKHLWWTIALAVVASVIWTLILLSGALKVTSSDY